MEQRTVVRFLTLKKLSARDFTAELKKVYGHEALSLSAVKNAREHFVNGRITLRDDPRSGRQSQSDLYKSLQALIDETLFISSERRRNSFGQQYTIANGACVSKATDRKGFAIWDFGSVRKSVRRSPDRGGASNSACIDTRLGVIGTRAVH
jgi:hypothetical protein